MYGLWVVELDAHVIHSVYSSWNFSSRVLSLVIGPQVMFLCKLAMVLCRAVYGAKSFRGVHGELDTGTCDFCVDTHLEVENKEDVVDGRRATKEVVTGRLRERSGNGSARQDAARAASWVVELDDSVILSKGLELAVVLYRTVYGAKSCGGAHGEPDTGTCDFCGDTHLEVE
ncbi:hypothetical protein L6452_19650 [Arctium lappa]|uniref:Uncharacterized protein n=1 Tax=Arctium lappa TaxID=4217 RepID=A0ACB9B9P9_ARCLA|nr:hypothetical protein L6452_19650 [Arctium lappa]